MESSVRTARIAVYTLLKLPKQVPDISPTQYDIRTIFKAARAINNGEPFPGERLLHRLLDKTYFSHILPPLPKKEEADGDDFGNDLSGLFGKGSEALHKVTDWLEKFRANLGWKRT
ncbi:hypothetical protein AA15973_2210 [Komagataeibacter sucrofermentans DSM 15973]|nr:hypothetical protein AA15973_2210 [Komagataeibacter sucrofermentans DSM 15973]